MSMQAYQAYQNNSVETASPGELTLMLYNGCLKFMKLAKKGIEEKNIELRNTNIQKAQKIVQELMITMNPDYSITQEVMPLYDYVNRRLMDANLKNDATILDEAFGIMTDFRDTWKEVVKQTRQQQFGAGGNA
ncbi:MULTISPECIES: flagellar export chaperone FliS [Pontibacillus]|uniref:Flagellar secretion chaperone FliS n=1 Tax=Pontibacillus chungwhensis TaxID=265426 RepID=A0ABY8UWD3_9BACI|nr:MULTISPECIES: flagellar export chaperone FliS [Pontibacillus]MCD5325903.1 flagellar export chaperone FliS [Pontibacillus sp. HN14]WIF97613.1 flagellar export chaperone FliS [Pontibacillus chungwhensis]